jgi:hypothetical protein
LSDDKRTTCPNSNDMTLCVNIDGQVSLRFGRNFLDPGIVTCDRYIGVWTLQLLLAMGFVRAGKSCQATLMYSLTGMV